MKGQSEHIWDALLANEPVEPGFPARLGFGKAAAVVPELQPELLPQREKRAGAARPERCCHPAWAAGRSCGGAESQLSDPVGNKGSCEHRGMELGISEMISHPEGHRGGRVRGKK